MAINDNKGIEAKMPAITEDLLEISDIRTTKQEVMATFIK
jgi:hypothetical protein